MAHTGARGNSIAVDDGGSAQPAEWRILVVDDDRYAAETCMIALSTVRGYDVRTELQPLRVQQIVREWHPDLIVLDVTMPKLDGFELAKRLKADHCPASLMFITSHGEPDYEVDGMSLAEDFIKKPYPPRVLLARVDKILQRRAEKGDAQQMKRKLESARPVIDARNQTVRVPHGREAELTPAEMRVLMALLDKANQLVTYDELLLVCWDIGQEDSDDIGAQDPLQRRGNRQLVQTNISRLRAKIERNPAQPELIVTVPRVGYRYILQADEP